MEIKMPAVFLCFDDIHIKEWYACREQFFKYDMTVTFYVTQFARLDEHDWALLSELQADGHTIGFHGLNHMRAGDAVSRLGCSAYMQLEILPGLKEMKDRGFNPQHFCYPRGNHNDESDRCLLSTFSTLRTGGTKLYSMAELKAQRIFMALNFGKWERQKYCGHEAHLSKIKADHKAVFFYMHRPVMHRLEYLGTFRDMNFYPMSALEAS